MEFVWRGPSGGDLYIFDGGIGGEGWRVHGRDADECDSGRGGSDDEKWGDAYMEEGIL